MLDALELELMAIMNHHVGTGAQTQLYPSQKRNLNPQIHVDLEMEPLAWEVDRS